MIYFTYLTSGATESFHAAAGKSIILVIFASRVVITRKLLATLCKQPHIKHGQITVITKISHYQGTVGMSFI